MALTPLIAGNWKMFGSRAMASRFAEGLTPAALPTGPDLLICPPAALVGLVASLFAGRGVSVGGQDCHAKAEGAHTGDTSAALLADLGARYVIVGHSERRADHGETNATVRAKAMAALAAGLTPILCVGETLAERDAGQAITIVRSQLQESLPDGATAGAVVIAYEPVWAIGTGRTPTVADIAEVHAALRAVVGDGVRILYGGSVKPGNAAEILAVANVNGALIGGASLAASDFLAIAAAAPTA
ncbi:MAG: triose-phosphate isomerase [Alphaproteobacteria bacterium]|nr:triose-phosphate isomerase [Alphaproteobacteria bacterium]